VASGFLPVVPAFGTDGPGHFAVQINRAGVNPPRAAKNGFHAGALSTLQCENTKPNGTSAGVEAAAIKPLPAQLILHFSNNAVAAPKMKSLRRRFHSLQNTAGHGSIGSYLANALQTKAFSL
jgi:hypothetical protein